MSALINVISSLIIFVSVIVYASTTSSGHQQAAPEIIPQPIAITPAVIERVDSAQDTFVKECSRYGFSESECVRIWNNEQTPISKHSQAVDDPAQLREVRREQKLDVDNKEYIARRDEVLKRPDAVIFQATLR